MLTDTRLRDLFNARRSEFMDDWKNFLRFASVSAAPEHTDDCRACADWLCRHLESIGFDSCLLETGSKPVVFGERPGDPTRPVILVYGHYDVQPADPLEAWETPPFEPTLRGDRLYARGAQDNKGQVMYMLKALQVLVENSISLPTIKLVIEGEEESGSQGISACMAKWSNRLAADVMMVHDTGMHASGTPTITMGLRGILCLTVRLTGPDHDLHSGIHGGLAPNPAQGMARLLNTLHSEDGRIAVEGYYDAVRSPSEAEMDAARGYPFDASDYQVETGCPPTGGMMNYSAIERVGFLPSLDINGIHVGYGGAGMKTIIPSTAIAKISSRLVPDQNPQACLEMIEHHLHANVPQGFRLEISEQGAVGPGFRIDPDADAVRKAAHVLSQLDERDVLYRWEGASIPIVVGLAAVAGAQPLLVGFGKEVDRIHAPNESFSMEQFRQGFLYVALVMQEF